MFFSTSTPQTLWDAFAPFTHFTRSNMVAYCSGCFFAVTVVKKNGTTGMVNIKTADDRKAK